MRTPQRRFALIRRYVLGVSLVAPLFFAQVAQSQAYLVQTNTDGEATGIFGMSVPGETQLFDIDFVFGSFYDVFGGVPVSNAVNFVGAINTELNTTFASSGFPPVISAPTSTFSDGFSFFRIPTLTDLALYIDYVEGRCTLDTAAGPLACTTLYVTGPPGGISVNADTLWAVPSPSAVPLPAALPLFGSALAMLGIVGWRRRRQAGA